MVTNWIIISSGKFNFVALKSGVCQFHPYIWSDGNFLYAKIPYIKMSL